MLTQSPLSKKKLEAAPENDGEEGLLAQRMKFAQCIADHIGDKMAFGLDHFAAIETEQWMARFMEYIQKMPTNIEEILAKTLHNAQPTKLVLRLALKCVYNTNDLSGFRNISTLYDFKMALYDKLCGKTHANICSEYGHVVPHTIIAWVTYFHESPLFTGTVRPLIAGKSAKQIKRFYLNNKALLSAGNLFDTAIMPLRARPSGGQQYNVNAVKESGARQENCETNQSLLSLFDLNNAEITNQTTSEILQAAEKTDPTTFLPLDFIISETTTTTVCSATKEILKSSSTFLPYSAPVLEHLRTSQITTVDEYNSKMDGIEAAKKIRLSKPAKNLCPSVVPSVVPLPPLLLLADVAIPPLKGTIGSMNEQMTKIVQEKAAKEQKKKLKGVHHFPPLKK